MRDASNDHWLAREQACLAAVAHRRNDPTFGPVIVRGAGSRVWDADGRAFFDLTCGYSAANFGHAFEPLVAVAQRQLRDLTHVTGMPHPGRAELAEQLVRFCGQANDKVVFNSSGGRAIETAWKAAVQFRPGAIVSISPAYHGRTLATSGLSDTCRSESLLPAATSYVRRPSNEYAYCAACPHGLIYPSCRLACQRSLIDWIGDHHREISAVVVEPALGARGYIVPPAEVWRQLRQLTRRHGILMIADEIQMGLGRCGDWLLSRQQGWMADLVVLGKSLGGGITPISAVVGRSELLDALPPGSESETFAASPLATAIGCEVMRQLATGIWMQRSNEVGHRLAQELSDAIRARAWKNCPPRVEVCGASATLEFISQSPDMDPQAAKSAAIEARTLADDLVAAGLLIHYSGPFSTRIVFLPALTIDDAALDEIGSRIQAALVSRRPLSLE